VEPQTTLPSISPSPAKVEDTAFPLTIGESATKIKISFKPGDKKLTIEKEGEK
jgi:hypothetical protein